MTKAEAEALCPTFRGECASCQARILLGHWGELCLFTLKGKGRKRQAEKVGAAESLRWRMKASLEQTGRERQLPRERQSGAGPGSRKCQREGGIWREETAGWG